MIYEYYADFITQGTHVLEHYKYCQKSRLFSYVIQLIIIDMVQIYKVFYQLVIEVLERLPLTSN